MIFQAVQAIPAVCTTAAATKTSSSILDPIAKPIADVLAFFYSLIPNYAVSILLLSLVWMLIISPLTLKTTRSMLAMQKLAPELKRLQEKHRNDRQALAQAQMDLYKTHNVSPFGSCLPTILPLPVFIALFRVIDGLSAKTRVDGVTCATPHFLSHTTAMYHSIQQAGGHLNAFGLDLAGSALSSHSSVATALPYYVLLLIMMGTQYVQTAQMMSRNPAAQQNSQMQFMKYLPLVFGLICIRFPAGVVLYYAMSNLCRIVQQDLMYRFDPKVKALAIKDVQEIEAEAGVKDEGEASGLFNRRGEGGGGDGASGRTRFRDLLGGELQKQSQAREQAKEQKSLPAGKSGGGASKAAGGSSKSTAGAGKAGGGAAAGSGSARSGNRSGSGQASGAPGSRKANAGRPNQGAGSGRSGSGRPAKAAPTKATAPTRSAGNGSGDGAGSGTSVDGQKGTGSPANGQRSGGSTPASGGSNRGTPSRTGSGSGRTGAGSGRTGAQGSRNKRRGN
ncbi:MAG: membrane protein insertase YidC [Acidimicrobiaceae bacterium]|nr:membrane protein insertase YidC [Acidimicrobiaceae bacterium]